MAFIYIGIKLAVYSLWCWYGMRLLAPLRHASAPRAFGLALARIALGFVLGFVWALLLKKLTPFTEYSRLGFNPAVFLGGLLVLRWLVWSVVSYLIRLPRGVLSPLGVNRADWLWRLGGVGFSFLADILVLVGVIGVGGIVC